MTLDPAPDKTAPTHFWVNLAIGIWSLAFILLCGRTLVLKIDHHSVYPVFTNAAQNWIDGTRLYKVASTEEFRYSPLVAAFFIPLRLLGPRLGQFIWRSLNFLVYVGGLLYCCKAGLPRNLSRNQRAALFILVLPLSVGSLNNAQSNPLVIGLMLIAIAAVVQDMWMLSAIAIALATLFKLYPVVLGLLLMLTFPKKMSWRMILWLAIGAVLPFALQRTDYVIDQYRQWAHYLVTEDRQGGPKSDWYRDLRAVWRIYISPMGQSTYLIVEVATGGMIALLCILGRLKNWPRRLLLTFMLALACCWMTALGPATESSTYILLAPSLVWAIIEAEVEAWRIAYVVVFGLFLVSQLAINLPSGRWFRDSLQPLPIAGLLFLAILVADAVRQLIAVPPAPVPTSHNV
jgi:Glycosyltransferase family 87